MTEVPRESAIRMARIGRHSVVYLAGAIAAKAVGFILLPVYTRLLSPADYGVLQLVELSIEIVSILAGSRLAGAIYYFYHKDETDDAKRVLLCSAFGVMGTAFTVAALLSFLLAPWIAQWVLGNRAGAELIQIASVTLALQGFVVAPTAMLQLQRRPLAVVSLNLCKLALQITFNLILLIEFRLGVKGVLLSSLIANAVVAAWLSMNLLRHTGWAFSRVAATNVVRFGVPLIETHAAKFLVSYGDRYVLQATLGSAAVGLYGLAYQFAILAFALGGAPHRTAWDPVRFEVVKRPDRDRFYSHAFIHHNLILVSLGVAVSLLVPELLRIMTTPPFFPAAQWVPILAFAFVMYSWSYFLNVGMYVKERPDLITRNAWIGAAVAIIGYFTLVRVMGAAGVAFANLIAYAVLAWLTHQCSQRLLKINYDWKPVVRLLAVAVVICSAAYALPALPLLAAVGAKLLLLFVYVGTCYQIGVLSSGDRELIRLLVRSPRRGLAILKG